MRYLAVLLLLLTGCVTAGEPDDDEDEDLVVETVDPDPEPSEPSPTTDPAETEVALGAVLERELHPGALYATYDDSTDEDQCLDLTGDAPVESPCDAVDELLEACALAFLTEDGPLAVLCDVEVAEWGVDLGYEGAYTTADDTRGAFGLSCRLTMTDGDGECTLSLDGDEFTYDPLGVEVGGFRGLALVIADELADDGEWLAKFDALRETGGLEGVLRSTVVLAEPGVTSPTPFTAARTGINAMTSLEQHRSIIAGAVELPPLRLQLTF